MLGGVSNVASFITIDKQLKNNEATIILMQAMLPKAFPFLSEFTFFAHIYMYTIVCFLCQNASIYKQNESYQQHLEREMQNRNKIEVCLSICLFYAIFQH